MTKEIAVEGCTLQFQNGGNGQIMINPNQTSLKAKAEGKGIYKTLQFQISGYTGQAITVTGSGTGQGEIKTTAQKVKVEGNLVFLTGDQSLPITINGQTTSGSSTVPATAVEIVKITDAGQTKVKGS